MPLVSAIVVTYGVKDYWRNCLDALMRQTFNAIEVILVDNSLNSKISPVIKSQYPHVVYHYGPKNLFYAEGLNKGISLSSGEFLLCMNDDVVLAPDFVGRSIKGFNSEAHVGMVSGKILRQGGNIIDSSGLFLSIFRSASERGYNRVDKGQFNKQDNIFGVSGALAFYRRSALDEIAINGEYFDPRFRMFYEDLDLAWRLQRKGWRGVYLPGALAYHTRGASARNKKGLNKRFARMYLSDELYWDLVKNRYLTIAKNETFAGFLLHFPFTLIYDLFAWAVILFTRPAIFSKLPLLLKLLISTLRHRKEFKERRN